MIKYKTVSTHTLEGLKRAEWYKAHGWKIGSVGLFTIQFYKESNKKSILEKVFKGAVNGNYPED